MSASPSGRLQLTFANGREFLLEYAERISKGVVFVPTTRPAAFGTQVVLDLQLPGTGTVIPLAGHVAIVVTPDAAAREGKRAGMGVRLASLSPQAEHELRAFVVSLQRGGTGKVLLVDDDQLLLTQVSDILKADGFAVTTAISAIKALDMLKVDSFDLVISDVNMPRMDGFEFRDNLRSDPKLAGLGFAFLTAEDRDEARKIAAQLGVRRFLVKPVDPEQLLRIAREAAAESAARLPSVEAPATRSQVAARRLADIAFRKMTALGMQCRFAADGQAVEGQVAFRSGRLLHAFTRAPIRGATVRSVQHDRVVFVQPPHLAPLPAIPILDLPDAAAFEAAVVEQYLARAQDQVRAKQFLERWSIAVELDEPRFRVLGRVQVMNDVLRFSVKDTKTIRLEALNATILEGVLGDAARLVDIADATSGVDVEIQLETVVHQFRAEIERAVAQQKAAAAAAARRPAGPDAGRGGSTRPASAGSPMRSPAAPGAAPAPARAGADLFARPGEFDLSSDEIGFEPDAPPADAPETAPPVPELASLDDSALSPVAAPAPAEDAFFAAAAEPEPAAIGLDALSPVDAAGSDGASEPVPTEPVIADDAVAAETVAPEPAAEEPVEAEPVGDAPVAAEPITEEPVEAETFGEAPVPEEPIAEEPVVAETFGEAPLAEPPVADDLVAEAPIAEESVVEQPVAEEPVAEEPIPPEPFPSESAEMLPGDASAFLDALAVAPGREIPVAVPAAEAAEPEPSTEAASGESDFQVPPELEAAPDPSLAPEPARPAGSDVYVDPTDPTAPDRVVLMCAICGGSYTVGFDVSDERMLIECPSCIRASSS